jgi:hypothetical protein
MLRSKAAKPTFDDIYVESPWINFGWDMDVEAESAPGHPRVYKSHERLASVQRGCKYIVTVRDPAKVAVSWWNFLAAKGAPVTQKCPTPGTLLKDPQYWCNMRFGASLMEYYSEYYACRDAEDVLVLPFEDLELNLRAHLPMIAEFAGIPNATNAVYDAVSEMCTKERMMEHGSKMDESYTYKEVLRLGRSPEPHGWMPAARVTKGSKTCLDDAAHTVLHEQWLAGMTSTHPELANYPDLVAGCRKSLHQRFPDFSGLSS